MTGSPLSRDGEEMEYSGLHGALEGVSARVQAVAARNLQLLQAIESTISALDSDVSLINAVRGGFDEIGARLQQNVPAVPIDSEGTVCNALSLASDSAHRMHAKATRKHQAACEDPRLTQEDGVAGAYEGYLATLEHLFDSIEHLREWIETHDALLEPSSGKTYKDVDELFAAMGL